MQFDTSANVQPANVEGQLSWNSEDGTLNLGMGGSAATQQIGLESYIRIYNNTGTKIEDGKAIYFSGAGSGDTIGGALMKADGSINPLRFIGVTTHDIENGQTGYVTNFGGINGLDTTGTPYGETWNLGDIIFVSATTPGALTKVRPIPPNVTVAVGAVARVGATNGRLMISPRIVNQINYGAFNSTTQQLLSAINTPQVVQLETTIETSGISGTGVLTVQNPALYSIEFSLSVKKSNASQQKVWVWLRRNGVDVVNTAVSFTIQGNSAEINLNENFAQKLVSGDTVSLMWTSDSTAVYLESVAATAFAPATPSARVKIFQINP